MPDLNFQIDEVEPQRFAAEPLLLFKLRVTENVAAGAQPTPVHTIVLRCQIRIEPARRRYEGGEEERLLDLSAARGRGAQTLRPMLWPHVNAAAPPFAGSRVVDLAVPCSHDFNLAATKF